MIYSEKGQSLMELVVVIAVVVIVVAALAFATIASLRNANLAKNQAQATKLAQEGLEKIRSLRDRNTESISYTDLAHSASKFSDLWAITFKCQDDPQNCYFNFIFDRLIGKVATSYEDIPPNFQRQVQIEDEGDGTVQKKITVIVRWSDFAGAHESRLTTILRKI